MHSSFVLSLSTATAAIILSLSTNYTPFASATRINTQTHDIPTRFPGVTWNDKNWLLTSQIPSPGHYQSRISLSNGYIGINLASLGPFFEVDDPVNGDNINGWPQFDRRQSFATVSGFWGLKERCEGSNYEWLYQYGEESVVGGVPHWGGLVVVEEKGGYALDAKTDPEHLRGFRSTLDIGDAVIRWEYGWMPGGGKEEGDVIGVKYDVFLNKLYVNEAVVRIKMTPKRDVNVTIYDVLEGEAATDTEFVAKDYERGDPTIWAAVRPSGIENITAYVYSTLKGGDGVDVSRSRARATEGPFSRNASSIAQSVGLQMVAGQTYVVEKYVGIASSDAFDDPKTTAYVASIIAAKRGYEKSMGSHMKEWNSIMPKDSVDRYHNSDGSLPADENIRELQITAVTNPFHLLQNTISRNAVVAAGNNHRLGRDSVPVCGLGSSCYAGLIFWDAEVFIAPGLQVSHPYSTRQIIDYRMDRLPVAMDNVKMAYSSSQNETGKFSQGGAVYPWTSGRYGNCTGTGPCFDYEYHLNGDIGISMYNYYAVTGDGAYFEDKFLPVYNAIAHFFAELLTYDHESGTYGLLNATDPDEYANNVNNAGFTLALIQKHFNDTNIFNSWFGGIVNQSWAEKSVNIRLPVDEEAGIILEYDGMSGHISVKQADVVLIDDLLHYSNNPYSLANLDYYAAKQSLDGPGMTYGVFSIVANEISPSGCSSYTYDLWSSQPYARGPWFQYSEQLIDDYSLNGGTHPAYPFLTGMGGSNRIAIFGYLGLRLFIDRLDINPSLPPQIPQITYRTFYWMGHAITATSNQTHTTLTRLPHAILPTANTTYTTSPIPVTLSRSGTSNPKLFLSLTEPLIIANRPIGTTPTIPGNIIQCLPKISSNAANLPGQIPASAIDGASSTKWQPAYSNQTSWLAVHLHNHHHHPHHHHSINGGNREYHPINKIHLDWSSNPPTHYEIIFSNRSLHTPPFSFANTTCPNTHTLPLSSALHKEYRTVSSSSNITLSAPYSSDPARDGKVVRYIGNQTNVTLDEPVWTGEWVYLGILGNQNSGGNGGGGEEGAMVAEWSLISEGAEGNRDGLVVGGAGTQEVLGLEEGEEEEEEEEN